MILSPFNQHSLYLILDYEGKQIFKKNKFTSFHISIIWFWGGNWIISILTGLVSMGHIIEVATYNLFNYLTSVKDMDFGSCLLIAQVSTNEFCPVLFQLKLCEWMQKSSSEGTLYPSLTFNICFFVVLSCLFCLLHENCLNFSSWRKYGFYVGWTYHYRQGLLSCLKAITTSVLVCDKS